MVKKVPINRDAYVGMQEALQRSHVGNDRYDWVEGFLLAADEAAGRQQTSFTVNVPMRLFGFTHPRLVTQIKFDLTEFCYDANKGAESIGIHKNALKRFGLMVRGGWDLKPYGFMDSSDMADKLKDHPLFRKYGNLSEAMRKLFQEVRKEAVNFYKDIAEGKKVESTYVFVFGQPFDVGNIGFFFSENSIGAERHRTCLRDCPQVMKAIETMYDYKPLDQQPDGSGRGIMNSVDNINKDHRYKIMHCIEAGYRKWQVDAAKAETGGWGVPKTYQVEVELVSRTHKERYAINVPVEKAHVYYTEKGQLFHVDWEYMEQEIIPKFSLRWRLAMVPEETEQPQRFYDVRGFSANIAGLLHERSEVEKGLGQRAQVLAQYLVNRVMEHKPASGNVMEFYGQQVDVTKDIRQHRR